MGKGKRPKLNLSMYDKLTICKNAYNRMFKFDGDESDSIHFICVAIEAVTKYSADGYKAYEIIPEILEYKPKDRCSNSHWFPVDEHGMNFRKEILEELIQRFKLSED